MSENFSIAKATAEDAAVVATMVNKLLKEMEPEKASEFDQMPLESIASELLSNDMIFAFIAYQDQTNPIGVVTMHRCAALYAGGVFGEIAELYVEREHRNGTIGKGLLNASAMFGREQKWTRLEVGAPDAKRWQKTIQFYLGCGFDEIGPRLRLNLS